MLSCVSLDGVIGGVIGVNSEIGLLREYSWLDCGRKDPAHGWSLFTTGPPYCCVGILRSNPVTLVLLAVRVAYRRRTLLVDRNGPRPTAIRMRLLRILPLKLRWVTVRRSYCVRRLVKLVIRLLLLVAMVVRLVLCACRFDIMPWRRGLIAVVRGLLLIPVLTSRKLKLLKRLKVITRRKIVLRRKLKRVVMLKLLARAMCRMMRRRILVNLCERLSLSRILTVSLLVVRRSMVRLL